MGISNIIAKGVGAAGVGLVAYDAHHAAKDYSMMFATKKSTDNLENLYYDTLYLQTPSRVKDKAKKTVLNMSMDYSLDRTLYKAGGYFKALGASVVDNIVPFGLSAMALLTKGIVSKASAIGAVAYAALDFIGEFGHRN